MSEPRDGGQTARDLPHLVIRVGVTGHRSGGLTQADPTLLCARLDSVLRDISAAAARVQREHPAVFAPGEPVCRIISALADGSDRIVADRAMRAGYKLQCPLPFAREEYARDFADDASRTQFASLLARATAVLELDGLRADPEVAYEHAGRVMLWESDIIIGIWNGEAASGRGGTAQMLREATACGIPVIWIHSRTPHACKLLIQSETGPETSEFSASSVRNEVRRALAPDLHGDARVERHTTSAPCGGQPQSAFFGHSGGLWRLDRPNGSRIAPDYRND